MIWCENCVFNVEGLYQHWQEQCNTSVIGPHKKFGSTPGVLHYCKLLNKGLGAYCFERVRTPGAYLNQALM